jgi:CheY-like chemotaxis protein
MEPKHILLVDDEELICRSLKRLLEKEGFQVTTAPNGEVAQNLASLEEFDVVISDIHMPGKVGGIELFHFIKKLKGNIPVILMTGFATLAETKEAHEIGVDGFLAKPFKIAELQKLLEDSCNIFPDRTPVVVNEDENYCRLAIDDFISGSQIQFNIFVRLSESKYVKIAYAGEDLSTDRIASFKEKGIRYLYLLKDDFQKYMRFNLGLAQMVKASATIPKEKKIHLLKHTGEVILERIYSSEMQQDVFEDAKAAVETAVTYLAESQETFTI